MGDPVGPISTTGSDAFHRQPGAAAGRRKHFEILQAIELSGSEAAGRGRRPDHYFHDGRRQTLDALDGRSQLVVEKRDEMLVAHRGRSLDPGEHAADDRIALLRAAHRLDDVAEKRRMQVTEVADRTAVGFERGQYRNAIRLRQPFHRSDAFAFLVERREILSVELKMGRVFAGEHGVRLRSRSHQ